jgi:hypothetical protein
MKATAKKAMRLPATKPAPSPLTSSDIKVLHFVEQNEVKDFQFRQKGASRGLMAFCQNTPGSLQCSTL